MVVSALLDFLSSPSFTFFFTHTATTEIYTLSLHDALPICRIAIHGKPHRPRPELFAQVPFVDRLLVGECLRFQDRVDRSEEHTSELQSRRDLVCRLLLEKKK